MFLQSSCGEGGQESLLSVVRGRGQLLDSCPADKYQIYNSGTSHMVHTRLLAWNERISMGLNMRDDGVTNSCSRDAPMKSRPLRQSVHRFAHDPPWITTDQHSGRCCHTCSTHVETATSCRSSNNRVSRIRHAGSASSKDRGRIGFLWYEMVALSSLFPAYSKKSIPQCSNRANERQTEGTDETTHKCGGAQSKDRAGRHSHFKNQQQTSDLLVNRTNRGVSLRTLEEQQQL